MSRRSLRTGFLLFLAFAVGYAVGFTQELPRNALPPGQPTATPQLKTLDEQAAYAIGLDIGHDVLANAPDANPELVARGVIDAMRKAKPLLSESEAVAALDNYNAKKMGPAAEKNLKEGQTFLAANKGKQGVTTTDSGLQIFVTKPGMGRSPKPTDVVRVNYKGLFIDGKVFDSNEGKEPVEFPLNRVIPAWTEALQKMKVGEKARLYVPPRLAYGPQGTPDGRIPPFSTLIFDVELIDIVQ